jgi:hypothetical protein
MSILKKNIYVDIDNTITVTKNDDYENAVPLYDRILIINKLYDEGNIITYWTARGTMSKINWYNLTKEQLKHWGAKHHLLLMGKPAFDVFIDDKAFRSDQFFLDIAKEIKKISSETNMLQSTIFTSQLSPKKTESIPEKPSISHIKTMGLIMKDFLD